MPGYRKGQPPANKGRRRTPDPFTQDEIVALVKQTSRRGHGGARDRALIVVLFRCGLRISEALNLRVRDVDLERGLVRVRHGKGDKDRIAAIDVDAAEILRGWLERRAGIPGIGPGGYVFCTISQPAPGGRMGAPQFRTKLKLLAERAQLDRDRVDVIPHNMRHGHATELAHEGKPLTVIQQQLGHEHLSTTEGYIRRIAGAQLLAAMHDRPELGI
jgi:site-specific recombinase XerD